MDDNPFINLDQNKSEDNKDKASEEVNKEGIPVVPHKSEEEALKAQDKPAKKGKSPYSIVIGVFLGLLIIGTVVGALFYSQGERYKGMLDYNESEGEEESYDGCPDGIDRPEDEYDCFCPDGEYYNGTSCQQIGEYCDLLRDELIEVYQSADIFYLSQNTLSDVQDHIANYQDKCEPEPEEICGDNKVEGGEECDDGNTDDGDGCDSNCLEEEPEEPEEICGDNIVEGGEECDDGNTADGDGCDSNCLEEEDVCPENVPRAGGYDYEDCACYPNQYYDENREKCFNFTCELKAQTSEIMFDTYMSSEYTVGDYEEWYKVCQDSSQDSGDQGDATGQASGSIASTTHGQESNPIPSSQPTTDPDKDVPFDPSAPTEPKAPSLSIDVSDDDEEDVDDETEAFEIDDETIKALVDAIKENKRTGANGFDSIVNKAGLSATKASYLRVYFDVYNNSTQLCGHYDKWIKDIESDNKGIIKMKDLLKYVGNRAGDRPLNNCETEIVRDLVLKIIKESSPESVEELLDVVIVNLDVYLENVINETIYEVKRINLLGYLPTAYAQSSGDTFEDIVRDAYGEDGDDSGEPAPPSEPVPEEEAVAEDTESSTDVPEEPAPETTAHAASGSEESAANVAPESPQTGPALLIYLIGSSLAVLGSRKLIKK